MRDYLLAISSNLRRLSYWAYQPGWEKKKKLIKVFLEESDEFFKKVPSSEGIKARRKELKELIRSWKKNFLSEEKRKIWAEDILTLSLRIAHLAKRL